MLQHFLLLVNYLQHYHFSSYRFDSFPIRRPCPRKSKFIYFDFSKVCPSGSTFRTHSQPWLLLIGSSLEDALSKDMNESHCCSCLSMAQYNIKPERRSRSAKRQTFEKWEYLCIVFFWFFPCIFRSSELKALSLSLSLLSFIGRPSFYDCIVVFTASLNDCTITRRYATKLVEYLFSCL